MKILITVRTGARQARIEKTDKGYQAYVKEQPIENRANRALIGLLSEYFNVPKSEIAIISGARSKLKIIEIKNLKGL